MTRHIKLTLLASLLIACNVDDADQDKKRPPVKIPVDMSAGQDAGLDMPGEQDMASDLAADLPPAQAPSDYARCRTSADCPLGTGDCLKSLPVRHGAPQATVDIRAVFPSLAEGVGICALPCSEEGAACAGQPGAVCQLVYAGEAPAANDPAALAQGQPFAALCRPPLGLSPSVPDALCAACVGGDATCGADARCWSALDDALASPGQPGVCVSTCQGSCPLGFRCEDDLCKPALDTCTDCRDADGDGRGLGRCARATEQGSPYDCDDSDPRAYYDPNMPNHPFPQHCGSHDLNCNGVMDDIESVGPSRFPTQHCAACFDACEGQVANGQRECTQRDGSPLCAARCEATHADCDGDVSNGCETPVSAASQLYYPDRDGDGYGDRMASPQFACGEDTLPAGTAWVQNNADCDDTSRDRSPDAAERCDNIDNNCNGQTDEGFDLGAACTVGMSTCARTGQRICAADGQATCSATAGTPQAEICDNIDNNCDGQIDEGVRNACGSCGPAPAEVCDNIDNDCDGQIDEGVRNACNQCGPVPTEVCDNRDNDCDGQVDEGVRNACNQCGAVPAEVCDGVDNNCNGTTDETCPCTSCAFNNLGTASGSTAPGLVGNSQYWYNNTDGTTASLICPQDQFLVGLRVRAGGAIDSIVLECNYMNVAVGSSTRHVVREGTGARYVSGPLGNNANSTQRTLSCASGNVINALDQGVGDLPDGALFHFRGRCTPLTIPGAAGLPGASYNTAVSAGAIVGQQTFGQTTGSNTGMSVCPDGKVANGLTGYIGRAWVGPSQFYVYHGIRLNCVTPTIQYRR